MSEKMKIIVLGTEDYLTKSLISLIVEKDVSENSLMKPEKYHSDTYEVTYIPYTEKRDIGKITLQPDMCLLVLKGEISPDDSPDVWQQIENLYKITGIPTEAFKVVLPLRHGPLDSYAFPYYTLEKLFRELAGQENQITKKRSADHPHAGTETDNPPGIISRACTFGIEFFSSQRSLKGNHSDRIVNLLLLGMSGTGKSASGNTILGKKPFLSRVSSLPVTTECEVAETVIAGTRVRVIDTPDIFDDEIKSSVKKKHVTKCRELIQSGPYVYLLVMQVGRFTDGERDILRKLEDAFGSEAKEQTVILLTHGKELQRAKISLERFLQDCQPELKDIVDQCGGRCVLFENSGSRQHQVTELMQTVNMMLDKQQNQ